MIHTTYLTVPEVADRLHCTPDTVRRHLRAKTLRGFPAFGRWLITEADLNVYLAAQANTAPSAPVVTRRKRRRATP